MLTRSSLSAVILLGIIAVSCDLWKSNQTGGSAADSDGDGLADVDETRLYNTSPDTKDTDGDGYDDYQEVRELGYDRSNPTKFNPLVADTPRIKIELITVPEVRVNYTRTKGETQTDETGETVTRGITRMKSRSDERSLSVTVGVETGPTGGVSVSGTAGLSVNLTEQETNEYQRVLSEMRSRSRNAELHEEAGQVRVAAAISNAGHIPFTLQNLTLTAARRDGAKTRPITQLEADSARPFFEMGTWVPGERTECVFIARNLPLSDVEQILTSDLIVQVGKYELKDANGQSFGHRTGAIGAACARVVIDQGGGVPAESYLVSTRTAPDERGFPLNAILQTLGMPFETGKIAWTYRKLNQRGQLATGAGALETGQTRNGLLSLGEVAADPQQGGHWVIIHETSAGRAGPATRRFDLLDVDYRLEDIRIKPRQAVLLSYVRDPDRDGLATSTELALGTDPSEPDTDGDGMADGDEQTAGTDPLWNNALPRPRIASMRAENLGQQVSVAIDLTNPEQTGRLHIQWGDGSLAEEIKDPRRTLTLAHRYESVGKYKIVATPYTGSRSPGERYEILVSTAPALTRKATIQFGTKGSDWLHGVVVDREGNAYLAGEVSDMSALTGAESGHVFLVKCGRSGEREWVEQFGAEHQVPGGLAVDREGNVHLATYDKRTMQLGQARLSSSLRMYTPAGELMRDLTLQEGRLLDLDLPTDGAYYLAQESWPTVLVWEKPQRAVRKMSVRPVGASGRGTGQQINWTVPLLSDVSLQAMAIDASDGLYACGHRRLAAKASSNDRSFVVRYSPKGELSWMRWRGNNKYDQSVGIAVDGPGNAYVVDLAAGGTPEKPNRGESDVRLVKYDPSGKVLWMRQFGTRLLDVAFSVAVWPPAVPGGGSRDAESVYVAGVTQGDLYDETKDLDSSSELNAFLVAYDRYGKRRFLEQFSLGRAVPPFESPTQWRMLPVSAHVATDEKGNVYLAGSSAKSLGANYQNKGEADIFLVCFASNQEGKK